MIVRPPESVKLFSASDIEHVLEMFNYGLGPNWGNNTYLLLGFQRSDSNTLDKSGVGLLMETNVPNVTAKFATVNLGEIESSKALIPAIKIQLGCGVYAPNESIGGISIYPVGGNRVEFHWQNKSETKELPLFRIVNEINRTIIEQRIHEESRIAPIDIFELAEEGELR